MAVPSCSATENRGSGMKKIHITKLSDNEFHFEYEDEDKIEEIQRLKEFEHEGQTYKVKHIIETFDLSGYHAFMVYAKPA